MSPCVCALGASLRPIMSKLMTARVVLRSRSGCTAEFHCDRFQGLVELCLYVGRFTSRSAEDVVHNVVVDRERGNLYFAVRQHLLRHHLVALDDALYAREALDVRRMFAVGLV